MDRKVINELTMLRYAQMEWKEITDSIICERPLNIFVNNKHYATMMCTPYEMKELAVGFLFSQGIIKSNADIEDITFSSEDIVFITVKTHASLMNEHSHAIVSGCGRGIVDINMIDNEKLSKISSKASFDSQRILSIAKEFNKMSQLFLQTGGVHSCCICDSHRVIYFSDDIGRHNAIDKVIGKCILNNIGMRSCMMFTTGRISSDSIIKAAKAEIPIIVSHSAPTDLAVDIAKKINMTLIGFARGQRMNLYCGYERVIR